VERLGTFVIWVLMVFVVLGAFAAIRDTRRGMGREFITGLHSIGPIFIPVAGIMASIPYLAWFIERVVGPAFGLVGADPAIASTTIIAVDMGGYHLAEATAESVDTWIIAAIAGYMAGATIVFSIPVGLAMLEKRDHKYMALGIMCGILTVPIGVFITSTILTLTGTPVRDLISTTAPSEHVFNAALGTILVNLTPLLITVVLIAAGLWFVPDLMIRIFMIFGRALDAAIKIVLAFSIVEYFTGGFSALFGTWGFDPIIADEEDQFRALEIAGYIGILLAGAFPMVYAIRVYLARPLGAFGRRVGISTEGSAGLLATMANIIAMYHLVRTMPARDKVLNIAFAVCAAFLFGDHLAFTANFQPNIAVPLILGKFLAGVLAILIAYKIAVPKALELEAADAALGIRSADPPETDDDDDER
jgi:ethanolamine transporter